MTTTSIPAGGCSGAPRAAAHLCFHFRRARPFPRNGGFHACPCGTGTPLHYTSNLDCLRSFPTVVSVWAPSLNPRIEALLGTSLPGPDTRLTVSTGMQPQFTMPKCLMLSRYAGSNPGVDALQGALPTENRCGFVPPPLPVFRVFFPSGKVFSCVVFF